jgi:hypothetical protein
MLFARTPEPGKVKTRLIPALGAEGACRLHRAMVQFALEQLLQTDADQLQLWLSGSAAAELNAGAGLSAAAEWIDLPVCSRLSRHRQQGEDLGRRMASGFRYNFDRGCSRVIVVGSDCPQLRLRHYQRVLAELEQHDAVIIPALDGGYVLLGLRRYHDTLFVDIPWGEPSVYQATLDKLAVLGWSWHSLAPLADIDRPEDLHLLEGAGLDLD